MVVLWLWFLYHSWGKPFQSKLYHDSLSLFTIQEKNDDWEYYWGDSLFSRWKRESSQGFITILKFLQRHPGISVILAIWNVYDTILLKILQLLVSQESYQTADKVSKHSKVYKVYISAFFVKLCLLGSGFASKESLMDAGIQYLLTSHHIYLPKYFPAYLMLLQQCAVSGKKNHWKI